MSRRLRFHAKPNLGAVKSTISTRSTKKDLDNDLEKEIPEETAQHKPEKRSTIEQEPSEQSLKQSEQPLVPPEKSSDLPEQPKKRPAERRTEAPHLSPTSISQEMIEDTAENEPSTSTETSNQLNQPTRRPRFIAKPKLDAFRPAFRPPAIKLQRPNSVSISENYTETTTTGQGDDQKTSAASSLLQLAMSWPSEPPPAYMMPLPLPPTPQRVVPEDLFAMRSPSPKKYTNLSSMRVPTPGSHITYPGSPQKSIRQRTMSTASTMSNRSKRPRTEELDTKTFTLSDLISWKPNVENDLKKKLKEKRKQIEENANKPEEEKEKEKAEKEKEENLGPKVKLDAAGNIVIDEESLIMSQMPETSMMQTIDDDLAVKKLNSWSFRKWKRTSAWSKLETDLFYEVLGACGPDFGLMQEYLPSRTRAEIKKKFNKEEKTDRRRIDERLKHPSLLDDTQLRMIMERFMALIETEVKAKENKKKELESRRAENRMRRSTMNSDIISGVSSLVHAHQTQNSAS